MPKVKSPQGLCLCTFINYSLILITLILFYYFLRRINRNGVSNQEMFLNFVDEQDIKDHVEKPLNNATEGINKIARALDVIERKLDIVGGYITLTDENEEKLRLEENKKILEDDDSDNDDEIEDPPINPLLRKDYDKYVYQRQSLKDINNLTGLQSAFDTN